MPNTLIWPVEIGHLGFLDLDRLGALDRRLVDESAFVVDDEKVGRQRIARMRRGAPGSR